jgi:hypothetical protein
VPRQFLRGCPLRPRGPHHLAQGWQGSLCQLLLEELIPLAEEGLAQLNLSSQDIQEYLGILRARVELGQNGATWQRRYVARHGKDMQQLTCAYWERQRQGQPVHTWDLD